MLDQMGKEINVGDTVVFGLPSCLLLHTGKIVKLSAKTVKVECVRYHRRYEYYDAKNMTTYQRAPEDVVIV